jgi:transposase-like protein
MIDKDFFLKPVDPVQRRYEALRACYVEGLTSREAARRFGVSFHTVNLWRRDLKAARMPPFFREERKGQEKKPSTLEATDQIIRLRKLNLSITEISERQTPADVSKFAQGQHLTTGYAGLFFFVPLIAELGLFEIFSSSAMHGSTRIPRENYLLTWP